MPATVPVGRPTVDRERMHELGHRAEAIRRRRREIRRAIAAGPRAQSRARLAEVIREGDPALDGMLVWRVLEGAWRMTEPELRDHLGAALICDDYPSAEAPDV
jgi:hypothetical protein